MSDSSSAEGRTTGPAAPPMTRRPPLRRPSEGRVLAGVAAGIADHLDVDVVIVRLLIVVATVVTSGFGLLVYLAAIFVIPEADADVGEQAARPAVPQGPSATRATASADEAGRDPAFWIGVALLVVGVLWMLSGLVGTMRIFPWVSGWRVSPAIYLRDLLWPLVLIGFGLALWKAGDRRGTPPPGTPPPGTPRLSQPPTGPPAPTPSPHAPSGDVTRGTTPTSPPHVDAAGPYRRPDPDEPELSPPSDAGEAEPSAGPGADRAEPTPQGRHEEVPDVDSTSSTTAPLTSAGAQATASVPSAPPPGQGASASPGGAAGGGGAGWDDADGGAPPAGGPGAPASRYDNGASWTPPERPRSSLLTRLTLGAALLTVGVLWILRLAEAITFGTSRVIAAALLVVGLGLIVGAWFGRGRWLILVGGILLPVVVVAELLRPFGVLDMPQADVRAGFGEIHTVPQTLDELESSYQLAAGSLRIDLSRLEFDEPTELSVSAVAGEVWVYLPSDVTADVTARVAVGELSIDGRSTAGVGVPERRQRIEQGDGSAMLQLDATVGFGQIRVEVLEWDIHEPEPGVEEPFEEESFGEWFDEEPFPLDEPLDGEARSRIREPLG